MLGLLWAGAQASAAETASIDALGFLPGSIRSIPRGVSADGGTVVGSSIPPGLEGRAFVWHAAGGMTALPTLLGDTHRSEALAVSADGSVIVGDAENGLTYQFSPALAPLRWDNGKLTPLPFTGPASALAEAISADGSTIIGQQDSDRILRWRNGRVETLATDLPLITREMSLSATGREGVAVDYTTFKIYHWSDSVGVVTARTSPSAYDGLGFYPQSAAITADGQRFFAAGGSVGAATNRLSQWQGFADGLPVPMAPALLRYGVVSHLVTSASGNLLAAQMRGSPTNVEEVALIIAPYGPLPLGPLLRAQGADTSHWHAITNLTAISADGRWVTGAGLTAPTEGSNRTLEAFRARLVLHAEGEPSLSLTRVRDDLNNRTTTELRWPATDLLVTVESVPALHPELPWQTEEGIVRLSGNQIILDPYQSDVPRLYRLRRLE
ncbi:MAG TPA: hypothetical protein VMB21_22175 [Candidatus Limnocylindria bacterium]|jgi:hypothetical protein|nr:hypothetical protein [Candidatus Limnocylindria bacterium]